MKAVSRGTLLVIVAAMTLVGADLDPAAAHGTCSVTSGSPNVDLNTWDHRNNHPWTWTASASCDEAHPDTYMRTCLEKSPVGNLSVNVSPDLPGLSVWSTVVCLEKEWAASARSFSFPGITVWVGCEFGLWYRTWTFFSTGNGGLHWGLTRASGAVRPCT